MFFFSKEKTKEKKNKVQNIQQANKTKISKIKQKSKTKAKHYGIQFWVDQLLLSMEAWGLPGVWLIYTSQYWDSDLNFTSLQIDP